MTTIQDRQTTNKPEGIEQHSASVPDLIAARARKDPDALALMQESHPLTYGWLDRQANRVAAHLGTLGVGRDVVVGLCLPRSFEMVIGALGIMKAGGAYLPMDPSYPSERLAFMLRDARAPVLITSRELTTHVPDVGTTPVYLDPPTLARYPEAAGTVQAGPADLAYVIYTSGSTGTPKGVEITHGGLANLVAWHTQAFAVTAADRASHVAGLGFDAAVWELWPYLASGASVHLAEEATRTSAELLREWLLARRITIGFVPTPLAERLLGAAADWPADTSLRILLTGGDTLHHFPRPGLPFQLVNNYGPTECTVVATSAPVDPSDGSGTLPPIGRAIAGARIRLLDERRQPVGAGETGQLCVGGAGLARGYRHRPDLTAERFIPDAFADEPGARLYLTGDLARQLPDGQYAFLGRIDDQIKIRGYRVEPDEISSVLNRHPDVVENVIAAREDGGEKRLVAYVVTAPASEPTYSGLREFLRGTLPEYMIPSAFVRLDRLPLTANGKVDRAALPAPESADTLQDDASAPPVSETEQRIAEIVGELLHLDEIDVDDNFFMLGGHSLLGAQLIARLRQSFGVDIALRSLFEAPTVAALSAEVERLRQGAVA
jgi:amino acid adenylation domain-containing protein